VTTDLHLKYIQLDELMQRLYKCSFDEFLNKFFRGAYDEGLVAGYKVGKADGRRVAKGLKIETKRRGRPTKMNKGLSSLLIDEVSKARAVGKTTKQGVERFLATMRRGLIKHGGLAISAEVKKLPTTKEGLGIYNRRRAHKQSLSQSPVKNDDALRLYVRELVKRLAT
jgi:hypothetical protein